MLVSAQIGFTAEEPSSRVVEGQVALTGNVVAVFCYLLEGKEGIVWTNREGQRHCIDVGSPIAIQANDRLYIVVNPELAIKRQLTNLVGRRATVRGRLTAQDGRDAILVTQVQRAKREALSN